MENHLVRFDLATKFPVWAEVKAAQASAGTVAATEFDFKKAIAANLKGTKSALTAAAQNRLATQAVRDALKQHGSGLADSVWQTIHSSAPWTELALFGPLSPTLNYACTVL